MLFYQEVYNRLLFFFTQINIVSFSMLIVVCLLTLIIYNLIDIIPYTTKVKIMWINNEAKIDMDRREKKKKTSRKEKKKISTIAVVMDIILELFCKALWHLLLIPIFVDFLNTISLFNSKIHIKTWGTITMIASTCGVIFSNSKFTFRLKYLLEPILINLNTIKSKKRENRKNK